MARQMAIPAGSIVVMDRGYSDYALFAEWDRQGLFFVTRLKEGAVYEVFETLDVRSGGNVLSDQAITLTGARGEKVCSGVLLRRIVVWDQFRQCELVLLTNMPTLASSTIGAIYKDRWEVELFFKCLKQNLKVKTFVGTTENALRIQIWTALIALLLLKWAHHLSRAAWSLSNIACMLRLNLFTYRDFMEWLHDPFGTPAVIPETEQLLLLTSPLGQAART